MKGVEEASVDRTTNVEGKTYPLEPRMAILRTSFFLKLIFGGWIIDEPPLWE
jgi:hypothetical protein